MGSPEDPEGLRSLLGWLKSLCGGLRALGGHGVRGGGPRAAEGQVRAGWGPQDLDASSCGPRGLRGNRGKSEGKFMDSRQWWGHGGTGHARGLGDREGLSRGPWAVLSSLRLSWGL